MKTMEDINELLKDFPITENGEATVPFGLEAHDTVEDGEIYEYMYNELKNRIDTAESEGKKIFVRVYPVLVKRSEPNAEGIHFKDAYFRLATI